LPSFKISTAATLFVADAVFKKFPRVKVAKKVTIS
jgi:hypothetical protein